MMGQHGPAERESTHRYMYILFTWYLFSFCPIECKIEGYEYELIQNEVCTYVKELFELP